MIKILSVMNKKWDTIIGKESSVYTNLVTRIKTGLTRIYANKELKSFISEN